MVHARHLGRLSTDQRTPSTQTPLGDTLDDVGGDGHIQLAARKVVEEVERLGTLDDQVVDAHRDEIDTDGIVLAAIQRDPELGSDTIRSGDQDGIPEAGALQVERAAESADLAVRSGATGRLDDGFDGVDEGVAVVDRDTGRGVGKARGGRSRAEGTANDVSFIRLREQECDSPMRDIPSVRLALKLDRIHTLVRELDGLLERLALGANDQNPSAVRDDLVALLLCSGMENDDTGDLAHGDFDALFVLARVPFTGEDDADGEPVLQIEADGIQSTLNARKHDFRQVDLRGEEEHERLGFRVAESDVVFEDLGSGAGKDEPSEQQPDEREACRRKSTDIDPESP